MDMPTVEPLFKIDKPHFHTSGGGLAVGYKLYTYYAGTNTPSAMFSDPDGTIPYQNPIVLDSRGEPNGHGIYANVANTYKVILKDPIGGVVWSMDDVSTMGVGSITVEGMTCVESGSSNVSVEMSPDGKTAKISVDEPAEPNVDIFHFISNDFPDGNDVFGSIVNGHIPVLNRAAPFYNRLYYMVQYRSYSSTRNAYFYSFMSAECLSLSSTDGGTTWTWTESDMFDDELQVNRKNAVQNKTLYDIIVDLQSRVTALET